MLSYATRRRETPWQHWHSRLSYYCCFAGEILLFSIFVTHEIELKMALRPADGETKACVLSSFVKVKKAELLVFSCLLIDLSASLKLEVCDYVAVWL